MGVDQIDELGGLISMEKLVDTFMELVDYAAHVGTVTAVTSRCLSLRWREASPVRLPFAQPTKMTMYMHAYEMRQLPRK